MWLEMPKLSGDVGHGGAFRAPLDIVPRLPCTSPPKVGVKGLRELKLELKLVAIGLNQT